MKALNQSIDIVFNVHKKLIEGNVLISIQVLQPIHFIRISAADLIWDMMLFRLEDTDKNIIQTGNFHIIEGIIVNQYVISRRTSDCS